MNQAFVDGRTGNQSPRRVNPSGRAPAKVASPSSAGPTNDAKLARLERKPRATTPLPDRLWNFGQVCTFLAVSERKGAQMRAEGLLPWPVVSGPRCLRWIPAEVMAAASNMPRQTELCEPAQLARARIERMKAP